MSWEPAPVLCHGGARADMSPVLLCREEGAVTLHAVVVTISQSRGPRSEPRTRARSHVFNHTSHPRNTDQGHQVKAV